MKTDEALQTARELLSEIGVCECGHTFDEHLHIKGDTRCRASFGKRCRCKKFRSVQFTVERKSR